MLFEKGQSTPTGKTSRYSTHKGGVVGVKDYWPIDTIKNLAPTSIEGGCPFENQEDKAVYWRTKGILLSISRYRPETED